MPPLQHQCLSTQVMGGSWWRVLGPTCPQLSLLTTLPPRSSAIQGAQCQVQQVHHPQRPVTLLPGGQGERATEEPNSRGEPVLGVGGQQESPGPCCSG